MGEEVVVRMCLVYGAQQALAALGGGQQDAGGAQSALTGKACGGAITLATVVRRVWNP